MSLEPNHVVLQNDVPKKLRLREPKIIEKEIRDPATGRVKRVSGVEFLVTVEDGRPVSKTYTALSHKHAVQLKELWDAGLLESNDVIITRHGTGYLTEYAIELVPI